MSLGNIARILVGGGLLVAVIVGMSQPPPSSTAQMSVPAGLVPSPSQPGVYVKPEAHAVITDWNWNWQGAQYTGGPIDRIYAYVEVTNDSPDLYFDSVDVSFTTYAAGVKLHVYKITVHNIAPGQKKYQGADIGDTFGTEDNAVVAVRSVKLAGM
jgi:hypothetical protein